MEKNKLTRGALKEAITGEFTAITKYGLYSTQAQKDGYPNIAYLFKALVVAEEIHLKNHRNALKEEFAVAAEKFTEGATLENVSSSVLLEEWEAYTMYPELRKRIKPEIKKKGGIYGKVAELSFEWAQKVEVTHAEALKLAKIALEAGHDLDLETIFICRVCGNLILTPPEKICPVCGHDLSFYMKILPVEVDAQ